MGLNTNCLYCGNPTKNLYCSYSCADSAATKAAEDIENDVFYGNTPRYD